MNIGSIHIPTVLAVLLIVAGAFVVGRFVLKKI